MLNLKKKQDGKTVQNRIILQGKQRNRRKIGCFYLENDDDIILGRELWLRGKTITYYMWPLRLYGNENNRTMEALLFFNLGVDFSQLVESMTRNGISSLRNAPTIAECLTNGKNDNYSSVALVQLKDITSRGQYNWCLVTKLDNVSVNATETEYVFRKVGNLYDVAGSIFSELNTIDVAESSSGSGLLGAILKGAASIAVGVGLNLLTGGLFGNDIQVTSSND